LEGLDDLERYLTDAAVLDSYAFTEGGGHPGKLMLVLEGGVAALAKPAQDENGLKMARREVAAWRLARALGWTDLLATTVLRNVAELGDVEASIQVIWPSPDKDPPSSNFSDEDVLRAGVFDAIVLQVDRSGHNWLGVPPMERGDTRLKLVDNGHTFGYPSSPDEPASTFYQERKGTPLEGAMAEAVDQLVQDWPGEIEELVGDGESTKAQERAQMLAQERALTLQE
jgi:hypothetical protein